MTPLIISIVVYLVFLIFIIFERIDKAIIALSGALILIVTGVLTPEQAISHIDFETILLLMGMMMIMYITTKSGIFYWISTKLAAFTKGNPFMLFVIFLSITALFSAFFDNVTTILIVVPITIALTKGMGLDPLLFVISEIMCSNIGGALTLIGDPPNILIGSAADLSFNAFIINLWMPITASLLFVIGILIIRNWDKVKTIQGNLIKLFLAHLLIQKIQHQFCKKVFKKKFIFYTLSILILTVLGFVFQRQLHLEVGIVAMCGAMLLLIFTTKHVNLHETFTKVEWPTLFFFIGLFILTGGLEETGVLNVISDRIIGMTDNFTILLIVVLWLSGIVSMLVDNIPFVAVMIPIIFDIQEVYSANPNVALLWWALSLGACLGGNGTLIGASANVVGASLATKEGVPITFMRYTKAALPLTLMTLIISSLYLLYRLQ